MSVIMVLVASLAFGAYWWGRKREPMIHLSTRSLPVPIGAGIPADKIEVPRHPLASVSVEISDWLRAKGYEVESGRFWTAVSYSDTLYVYPYRRPDNKILRLVSMFVSVQPLIAELRRPGEETGRQRRNWSFAIYGAGNEDGLTRLAQELAGDLGLKLKVGLGSEEEGTGAFRRPRYGDSLTS